VRRCGCGDISKRERELGDFVREKDAKLSEREVAEVEDGKGDEHLR